jgi:hypothetical protein
MRGLEGVLRRVGASWLRGWERYAGVAGGRAEDLVGGRFRTRAPDGEGKESEGRGEAGGEYAAC